MVRTQVYLTDDERNQLAALAQTTGRSQSQLIREAIDRYLTQSSAHQRDQVLRDAAGSWQDRDDVPDFESLRRQWDRLPDNHGDASDA